MTAKSEAFLYLGYTFEQEREFKRVREEMQEEREDD